MAYFYIAVQVRQDRNERVFTPRPSPECDPGYYADVIRCAESDNLASVLDHIGGLVSANICPTKKRAREVADYWNRRFMKNGTYFFDGGKTA